MKLLSRAAFLLALLPLAASPALAQHHDDDHEGDGGAGFFSVGVNRVQIDALNSRLSEMGYPTFERALLAIGGGGYGVVADVIMLGGEGYGLFTGEKAYQGRSVSLGGGYGFFNVGYLHRLTPHLRVYPMLGLGGGGLTLQIGSAEAGSFDEVLQNPNRQATLTRGSFLVSLGGGLEYRFGDAEGGFLLGLRAGYLLAPYRSDWHLGDEVLGDGPDASLAGPFVRLTIGGGGK